MRRLADIINFIANLKVCNHRPLRYVITLASCVCAFLLVHKMDIHIGMRQHEKPSVSPRCKDCSRKIDLPNTPTSDSDNRFDMDTSFSVNLGITEGNYNLGDASDVSTPGKDSSSDKENDDTCKYNSSIEIPRAAIDDEQDEILSFLTEAELQEHQIALQIASQEKNSSSISRPSCEEEKLGSISYLEDVVVDQSLFNNNQDEKISLMPFDESALWVVKSSSFNIRNEINLGIQSPPLSPVTTNMGSPNRPETTPIARNLMSDFDASNSSADVGTGSNWSCLETPDSPDPEMDSTVTSSSQTTSSQQVFFESLPGNRVRSTRYNIPDDEYMEEDKLIGDKGKKPMSKRYAYKKGKSDIPTEPAQPSAAATPNQNDNVCTAPNPTETSLANRITSGPVSPPAESRNGSETVRNDSILAAAVSNTSARWKIEKIEGIYMYKQKPETAGRNKDQNKDQPQRETSPNENEINHLERPDIIPPSDPRQEKPNTTKD